jgi:hypothetical protein
MINNPFRIVTVSESFLLHLYTVCYTEKKGIHVNLLEKIKGLSEYTRPELAIALISGKPVTKQTLTKP